MKLIEKTNNKIQFRGKNLVAKLALTLSIAGVATGLAGCKTDYTSYQQDLADKLINVLNQTQEENFSNAKFRNITAEEIEDKNRYSVYLVAQKEETPYFVKANLTLTEFKSYGDSLKHLSTCVDDYKIDFQLTETTSEIINKLNDLLNEETLFTSSDEYTFDYNLVNGYFLSGDNLLTFDTSWRRHHTITYTTVVPICTGKSVMMVPQVHSSTTYYRSNSYTTVKVTDTAELNNLVLNYLDNMGNYYFEQTEFENKLSDANIENLNYEIFYEDQLDVTE